MENNLVSETLKKIFTHWTEKQVSDLTAHIFAQYGNINTDDSNTELLDLLNTSIMVALDSYTPENVEPGLIRQILPQQLSKQKKNEQKKYGNQTPADLGVYAHQESKVKDFDLEKYLDKLERFENYVLRKCRLTPTQEDFFKIWVGVMKKDTTLTGNAVLNPDGISIDLMDEVFSEVQNKMNITGTYFRKLLSDIREILRDKRDDITGEMMSFIPAADADLEELKAFLIAQINFSISSRNHLTAYRFSVEELEKMIWLKKLFEENGFNFEPNRFPEVYYDDFEKTKDVFPEIKDDIIYGNDFIYITPDSLGAYIYSLQNNNINRPCAATEEGVIVLFKDRIESYSSAKKINPEVVRWVVLMHELGHWFAHWALKDGKNWRFGFHLPIIHTGEAFSQIVAYWASESNEKRLKTLTDLSPIDSKTGKVDGTKPYGDYIELTKHSKVLILKKMVELREYWILKDEFMIEYLKSDDDNIEDWLKNKLSKNSAVVFIENELKEAIYNEDCADTFIKELDFKKMLDLSILKIELETIKNIK